MNLTLEIQATLTITGAGMLSLDGRCKALDVLADGYVRGEAVAALLLRALGPSAPASGADLLLLGSAVNQDGRSSSLTAPNGPAQQVVMRAALRSKGIGGGSVAAIQLHGTGTALGDPIEAGALRAVLLRGGGAAPLAIGALKSATGHTEPLAGLLGLLQVTLDLTRGALSPIQHFRHPSPLVLDALGVDARPWFVPRAVAASPVVGAAGTTRVGGVSR